MSELSRKLRCISVFCLLCISLLEKGQTRTETRVLCPLDPKKDARKVKKMQRDLIRETLREVLSLQGSDVPLQRAKAPPSSDDDTEGEVEQQVAMEAKTSHARAHLEKTLELLGVFPSGIERGYCVIPRGQQGSGKRRVVQIVVEDAHIGSTVLALWGDGRRAARPGTVGVTPSKAATADMGEAKFWPATIKRFTGEYVGLTDLADAALSAFGDFDLVEDHANTLPFLLCVDLCFAVDESESRQRLVWSSTDGSSVADTNSTKSTRTPPSISSSASGGTMLLLPSMLPDVVSVRNYSVMALRSDSAAGSRNVSAMAVDNPMVSAPISANEIVFERARKSGRFTLLTVRDAGVIVQAKQQAIRDLRDRWRRARATMPSLPSKASLHSLVGSSDGQSLATKGSASQAALRPLEAEHEQWRRRSSASDGVTAAPLPPPTLVSPPSTPPSRQTQSTPPRQRPAEHYRSFLDMHDIGTADPHSTARRGSTLPQAPSTPPSKLHGAIADNTQGACVSPPRSERLPNRPNVKGQPQRARASDTSTVAIPRLQGANIGLVPERDDANETTLANLPSHPARRRPPSPSPQKDHPLGQQTVARSLSKDEPQLPAQSPEDRAAAIAIENKMELLKGELLMLRRMLHERTAGHSESEGRSEMQNDLGIAPLSGDDKAASESNDCSDGLSPAPVPREDAPRPSSPKRSSIDKGKLNQRRNQFSPQSDAGVKLWRKAPETVFPPNSYVFVDPNARSVSPLGGPSGRSQIRNDRSAHRADGTPISTIQSSGGRTPRSAIAIDAHYHRSLAYKETVRRAIEDSKRKGLDAVRRQQKQHSELFRRDTRELDSSPVLQRKQVVIEKAERSASRSPLGSRTPSVASRGQVSPNRTTSPTQRRSTSDVFRRLAQPSSTHSHKAAPSPSYVPPPPIGRSASATRGIVAAVSAGPAGATGRVRRSISPDFDVTPPADDDDGSYDREYPRRVPHHPQHHRVFDMPTLARGVQS